MARVPMMDLSRRHKVYMNKIESAVSQVLNSSQFILGKTVSDFEYDLAEYAGVSHVVGVSSGTDGLLVALMALGIGPGDEVIVPSFTFFSTAGAVSRLGATPVFCDVCPDTFLMTYKDVKGLITDRTKAVIPVHLFGQMCDVNRIAEILPEGVYIVEDAAQSLGAKCEDGFKFDSSICSVTSFFPTKNLGGFGDGGAVLTDDGEFASRVRVLRAHGADPKYTHKLIGGNFRLDAIQAAALSVKLKDLDKCISERRVLSNRYHSIFEKSGMLKKGVISLPKTRWGAYHTFNQYVVMVPQRDEVRSRLKCMGIETMVYYPSPLHSQECFSDLGLDGLNLPNSVSHSNQVLALPCFPGMRESEQQDVVDGLKVVLSELFPERFIPKVLIITAMWKRREIEDICFSHMNRLSDRVQDKIDISFLSVGSEGDESRLQAEKYGHEYIEFPNSPLGEKWNALWNHAIKKDVDAICIMGSDDIITHEAVDVYLNWFRSRSNAAGFRCVGMIDTASRSSIVWRGYRSKKRESEPHGLGRIIKIDAALKIGRDPFPSGRDSGMDRGFYDSMVKSGAASEFNVMGDMLSLYCFDIKSKQNIWRVSDFTHPSRRGASIISPVDYAESITLIDDEKTQSDIMSISNQE